MREKEQGFLYKKDSKITSVKDLKGKKNRSSKRK
ncbi:ABC transporter substrate-binding protein [Bacillus paranthracis]